MAKKTAKRPPVISKSTSSFDAHLLRGETLSFSVDAARATVSDEELNSRYARGDIRIVTESARYSLAGILKMLQETIEEETGRRELRYKLDPEYQRRHRWNNDRKSRLIESFLLNVPIPPVFLYERELARFEVMDGRQRLTTLSEFYDNKFRLSGLEHWSDLDGRTYSQLPSKIRDGIDRRYISSIILLKETATSDEQAAMLKKMVFERLNSGGVKLEHQETRNAIYNGPLNRLCLELSEMEPFRQMWGIPLDPNPEELDDEEEERIGELVTKTGLRMFSKMEDVELVLRFFAYRQIHKFRAGLNKISEFLDQFIVQGNLYPAYLIDEFRSMFGVTVEFLWDALGADAFCMIGFNKRPAKIVYDPLMLVASGNEVLSNRQELINKKDVLRSELQKMYTEHRDLFSGRRTNSPDIQNRNRCVSNAFAAAIQKVQES